MALPIPTLLYAVRLPADNPVLRVTLNGTTENLTFTASADVDHFLSGDGSVVAGDRDLVRMLETTLRSHSDAASPDFDVTLSADSFVTIACSASFNILWSHASTTLDDALFGFAGDTGSVTSITAPDQTQGVWGPGQPWSQDSGDEPDVVGSLAETGDGESRGYLLESEIYSRRIDWTLLLRDRILTAHAPGDRPYGALEYAWTTGGVAEGARVRVYADRGALGTPAYSTYRRASLARPWSRRDDISTLRYAVGLSLRRCT